MDRTRSRIIMYALLGGAAQAATALCYEGAMSELLLSALLPALIVIALLAWIGLKQLDAAHSLSTQLGRMIERKDVRFLVVPAPGCPEMSAIGHQLNVLIYSMAATAESANDGRPRRIAQSPDESSSHREDYSAEESGSNIWKRDVGARFTAR